jgi:hypothetical protein
MSAEWDWGLHCHGTCLQAAASHCTAAADSDCMSETSGKCPQLMHQTNRWLFPRKHGADHCSTPDLVADTNFVRAEGAAAVVLATDQFYCNSTCMFLRRGVKALGLRLFVKEQRICVLLCCLKSDPRLFWRPRSLVTLRPIHHTSRNGCY